MQETFSKIAVFQYSSEAQIIKSRLEAEGVEVFLFDQFTIDTDPLVSNAIGGIKLKVWAEDEAKALHILKSISEYSLDDDGQEIECPICGSTKVELATTVKDVKSFLAYIFSFLSNSPPINTRHEYRCNTCKQKFDLE
ncbi:putative signal transducing protein [Gillisia sp. Q332]|uniref:putative signal transducing protein n=1 Tax=Gillisia xinjiangensis TaxID=3384765 RepID=UPI0039188A74